MIQSQDDGITGRVLYPIFRAHDFSRRYRTFMHSLMLYLPWLSPWAFDGVSSSVHERGSSGCGSRSSWTFNSTNHSNQTLSDRTFLVHIPAAYDSSVAHALVLSYHGAHGTDVHQELISGFSEEGVAINDKGVIAVYPMGAFGPGKDGSSTERAWEGAPYAKPGVDDIAFTHSIIDAVQANLCVDTNRIYAAGKSNGGGFVNLLACTASATARIAAFAPISAALYPGTKPFDGCEPGRPVPLLNYHGLSDHTIPFGGQASDNAGNTDYATPNITQYREAWARRNGCATTATPSLTHPHTNTTLKQWTCSATDPDAVVKGYTVQGLGHSWPTTDGLDGGTTDFNATTADILPFFNAHVLM